MPKAEEILKMMDDPEAYRDLGDLDCLSYSFLQLADYSFHDEELMNDAGDENGDTLFHFAVRNAMQSQDDIYSVSYTHLTLPTILRV